MRGLFRIWALFAGPGARGAVEAASRGVVRELLHRPEDRPLDGACEQKPPPGDVAMLRIWRLLLVDNAPDLVENLLAHDAGQQAQGDRHGGEEHLRHSRCIPERLYDDPARV